MWNRIRDALAGVTEELGIELPVDLGAVTDAVGGAAAGLGEAAGTAAAGLGDAAGGVAEGITKAAGS